jgi:hypothetical protein
MTMKKAVVSAAANMLQPVAQSDPVHHAAAADGQIDDPRS